MFGFAHVELEGSQRYLSGSTEKPSYSHLWTS